MKFKSLLASAGPGPFVQTASSTMKIERVGKLSVTIPANTIGAVGVVTLLPVLPDSTLTNYLVMATINDPNYQSVISVTAYLLDTGDLGFWVSQLPNATLSGYAVSGVTVKGTTLTSVSGFNSSTTKHGGSDSLYSHKHENLAHTVTEPNTGTGHQHPGGTPGFSGQSLTVNVDWMIIHI